MPMESLSCGTHACKSTEAQLELYICFTSLLPSSKKNAAQPLLPDEPPWPCASKKEKRKEVCTIAHIVPTRSHCTAFNPLIPPLQAALCVACSVASPCRCPSLPREHDPGCTMASLYTHCQAGAEQPHVQHDMLSASALQPPWHHKVIRFFRPTLMSVTHTLKICKIFGWGESGWCSD